LAGHCGKYKGTTVPEYEGRGALGTFIDAVAVRNTQLRKPLSSAKRNQTISIEKNLRSYVLELYKFEVEVAGGGTMYLDFHALRAAEVSVLMRDLLEKKLRDPGSRKVSDGKTALKVLSTRLSKIEMDPQLQQNRSKAENAAKNALKYYDAIVLQLKTRSRKESNAIIDFVIQNSMVAVLENF